MTDVQDDIKAALEELKTPKEVADTETEETGDLPDDTQDVVTDDVETQDVVDTGEKTKVVDAPKSDKQPAETVEPAPVAWGGAVKSEWANLPPAVRAEIKKREDDIHRMMTSHEGDLRMGRSVKEIAAPYEAIIRSEGGTVEGAFKDLLNTAYVLRTGTPQQKAQLLHQTAKQFGINLDDYNPYAEQDPRMVQMEQEIQRLRQAADPSVIKNQLQQQMEHDRITQEVNAFAANPENVHFQTVKAQMGALMGNGQAKNLQDAYDQACWANPSIRAELLKAQNEQDAAKRKAEMEKKKKAATSVKGSPDGATPAANQVKRSIEDDLREAMKATRSSAI